MFTFTLLADTNERTERTKEIVEEMEKKFGDSLLIKDYELYVSVKSISAQDMAYFVGINGFGKHGLFIFRKALPECKITIPNDLIETIYSL